MDRIKIALVLVQLVAIQATRGEAVPAPNKCEDGCQHGSCPFGEACVFDGCNSVCHGVKHACGGHLQGKTGTITSPGHPGNYPDNKECTWYISVTPPARIRFNLGTLRIESSAGCVYDSLEIEAPGAHASRFCGVVTPKDLTTPGSSATVHFQSDRSHTDQGFSITYTAFTDGGDLDDRFAYLEATTKRLEEQLNNTVEKMKMDMDEMRTDLALLISKIDDCATAPCQHGATCTDLVNDYKCTCAPGYTGRDCSTDIDDCATAPCQHGATCTDLVNDYKCTCAPGYTGGDCSTEMLEKRHYYGCFKDRRDREFGSRIIWEQTNTPEKCIEHCLQLGQKYAGLQFGTQCYCGNSYGKYGRLDEEECNKPCPGDSSLTCGGVYANAVYGTSTTREPKEGCYGGWTRHKDACYQFFKHAWQWHEAKQYCKDHSAELTSSLNADENEFLSSFLQSKHRTPGLPFGGNIAWLGGTDRFTEHTWIWTNGDEWQTSWHAWFPGQPDNSRNEDCMILDWRHKKWNDLNCWDKLPFICKRNAPDHDQDRWISVMSRTQGNVNFYQDWQNYVAGFGASRGDHWIGLSQLHRRCNEGSKCQLRVDLGWTGTPKCVNGCYWSNNGEPVPQRDDGSYYALYSTFYIDDESNNFRLHVSGYSGNAGDSLKYHNGHPFTTRDRDNDKSLSYNCAEGRHGAWWYSDCALSNPTGRWRGHGQPAMFWYSLTDFTSVDRVELKVKPL